MMAWIAGAVGLLAMCGALAVFACIMSSRISRMEERLGNDIKWRRKLTDDVRALKKKTQ